MVSRFTKWIYLTLTLSLGIIICFSFLLVKREAFFSSDSPEVFQICFVLIFCYLLAFLIFGEIRQKLVKVYIGDETIERSGFFGVAVKKYFKFRSFDGYKISVISSKTRSYEYLYLMKDKKKVLKLSQFYHANYFELKAELIRRGVKSLGFER